MKSINTGELGMLPRLDVLLVELVSQTFLARVMVKCTNVSLVAARAVTLNPLVLVRMVESLHRGVTLVALETALAVVPTHATLQRLTVLWCILKKVGWTPEIACVVRINTTLRIVAVLLIWTPTCLVEEHVKHVALLTQINFVQLLVQVVEFEQAWGHEIVLDALVLKVAIHGLN